MIELSFIFFQTLFFFFIYSINLLIDFKKYQQLPCIEVISLNFLLHSNLILILSIFNLNISEIIFLYIGTVFVIFLFFFKKNISIFFKLKNKNIIFLLYLLILSFIIMVEIGNNLYISWDAEGFWLNKTINFYENNRIESLNKLANSHYPFFGAVLNATYWKLSFIKSEYSGRLIFAFIFSLSILNLVDSMLLTKISKSIIFFLILILTYDYELLFTGNQEILIFSLICIAMKNLYQIKSNKDFSFYRIFSILLVCNLLIWTKQEGVFYAIFLIICFFSFKNFNLTKKFIYLFFVLTLIFIRLFVFKYYNFEITLNKSVLYDQSISNLLSKLSFDRFEVLIKYFILSFFKNYFFY